MARGESSGGSRTDPDSPDSSSVLPQLLSPLLCPRPLPRLPSELLQLQSEPPQQPSQLSTLSEPLLLLWLLLSEWLLWLLQSEWLLHLSWLRSVLLPCPWLLSLMSRWPMWLTQLHFWPQLLFQLQLLLQQWRWSS